MSRSLLIISCALLLCISACSSHSPIKDQYYVLNTSQEMTDPERSDLQHPSLVVGPVILADFLNQNGLPMQTSENQVSIANRHLWAEPLDTAIAKIIAHDITAANTQILAERDSGRWTSNHPYRLRIEFDSFNATWNSNAVTAGQYWLYDSRSQEVLFSRRFSYSEALEQDGYAAAVMQLRALLQLLSADISAAISASNINTSMTSKTQ